MRGNSTTYDVVIVGAGTAGRVLAARLTADPGLRVLLLGEGRPTSSSFARGHRSSYDPWPAGWNFFDLLPYFKRGENAPGRDLVLRGRGGPLEVPPPEPPGPFATALLDAGLPRATDLGSGFEEGVGPADRAVVTGPDLAVIADGHRLVIHRGRVTGVEYRTGGRLETASAGEVVLAAGAVGSARLLLSAGLGPAGHLRAHGVDVVADLPGVGSGLQDHAVATMAFGSARPALDEGEVVALARSRDDLPGPDLRLVWAAAPDGQGWTVGVTPAQPWSRGVVRLGSSDPDFYGDERDLEAVVAGLRLARRISRTAALAPWRDTERFPGPEIDDETQLREYARRTARSAGSPAGTLALGPVVDAGLRLRGVEGIRVADASVLPSLPSAGLTATVAAIAERAADLVLGV